MMESGVMGFPGLTRPERRPLAEPVAGHVYVERRPGESAEAFEMRLAAAAREREAPTPAAAYTKGRRDQRQLDAAKLDGGKLDGDKVARGRRHRGGGFMALIGFLVVVIAAVGVLWMGLAYREGSFAAGGAVVDRKLAEVTQPARVAAVEAVDKTGQAVQGAGQAIETQGQRLRETAK
jgi:hypothetical protein